MQIWESDTISEEFTLCISAIHKSSPVRHAEMIDLGSHGSTCCTTPFPSRCSLIRFSEKLEGTQHPRGRHVNEIPSAVHPSATLRSAQEEWTKLDSLPIMRFRSQQRFSGFYDSQECNACHVFEHSLPSVSLFHTTITSKSLLLLECVVHPVKNAW
jgi:hypothetical protein